MAPLRLPRLPLLSSVAPLAMLAAYGVAFASVALGTSLIAVDDHPGQLYRVWHVVVHGWPPWTWNPGWWAGYPELQFYPPALAYVGAALHLGSLGALSIAASYQTLVWIAYLSPAVTSWLLLRRVLGDGWLAMPGAFVALTLSGGLASGVDGAARTGMVAARLGWAMLPLIALALAGWTRGTQAFPWSVSALVAAVALTHPAHLPAAVVLVALASVAAAGSRRRALGVAAAASILAAGLTAFWSVPLLARLAETRALAWGALSRADVTGHPVLVTLLVLAALGLVLRPRTDEPRLFAVVSIFPWTMAAVVAVDAIALESRGVRWLPADRVVDSFWLGIVLAAGATAGHVVAVAAQSRPAIRALAAVALTAVAAVAGARGETLTVWPRASGGDGSTPWPRAARWSAYSAIDRGMRLEALWAAVRAAPPGRVLFVRSGVPLVYGPEWWRPHTHVTALTPLTTGRPIVNGTFTHPSPLAALVYRGDAGPGAIRELVERLDGQRLFGRPLDALDAATFNDYAERLGVGLVVVLEEDLPRLVALRDNPLFPRATASPPFTLFARRSGVELPAPNGPGRLRMTVTGSGTWVSTRLAYYPLWRAFTDGRALPTRRGALGDLEVRVDRAPAVVDLAYAPGAAETTGVAITALSLVVLAVAVATTRRRSAATA